MPNEHVDVLIIGAGVSGVGAACHVSRECPGKSYTILERRQRVGGTWDLFRYPGVRSDSDMYTFGYRFRPWLDTRILADGTSIRNYVEQTAREYGVDEHIRFNSAVTAVRWSSDDNRWTVEFRDEETGETHQMTATFMLACSGYYDYDSGYRPDFAGEERFGGTLVHPQHWPEDLDHAGKKVVIIGSGATAVTLVPAMAETAEHVTMLQRSPSYIISLPAVDKISAAMGKVLSDGLVYKLARARNIALQRLIYAVARARPRLMRSVVQRAAARKLAGSSDMDNFSPKYDPWDQRLCIVPDGDLFASIREGRADVVTDTIKTFTETGVELDSGKHLDADIVVVATGLQVQMLGGAALEIDGEPVRITDKVTYKATLLEDMPNAALVFGYTNASWTLKADIAAEYVCRLLRHMDDYGYTRFVVRATDAERGKGSVLSSLNAGYVRRGDDHLPRQGRHGPWKVRNDYLRDAPMLRRSRVDDGIVQFSTPAPSEPARPAQEQIGA
jgi:cation diffusion facilitator CzcD-associated flavoprotein CzcO